MEKVIIVSKTDYKVGTKEKLEAHMKGFRHRAFSIFVFNHEKNLLLQRRADTKYHSAGLWSNTCCGHPRPKEKLSEAANRRLYEEMGFRCNLNEKFTFQYRAKFENGLRENEIDHVFTGTFDGIPQPNPDEVKEYKWVDLEELYQNVEQEPELYTYWFPIALEKLRNHLK